MSISDIIRTYDPLADERSTKLMAADWKHFFGGFQNPEEAVQGWIMTGVLDPEYAAYLSGQGILPEDIARFQVWLGEVCGVHFMSYQPAHVARAYFVRDHGGDVGDVMAKLAPGKWAS